MMDEDLDVVFVYESERPERLQEIQDKVSSNGSAGEDEMTGLLSQRFADDGPPGRPNLPQIIWSIQQRRFDRKNARFGHSFEHRFEVFFDTIETIYHASQGRPAFAYAVQYNVDNAIVEIGTPPVDADAIADDRINYAVWLNVFPPPLVETYGKETLLSAPVWRTDEWDDGSILLVAYEDPMSLAPVGELNEHLGLNDPGL